MFSLSSVYLQNFVFVLKLYRILELKSRKRYKFCCAKQICRIKKNNLMIGDLTDENLIKSQTIWISPGKI